MAETGAEERIVTRAVEQPVRETLLLVLAPVEEETAAGAVMTARSEAAVEEAAMAVAVAAD